MPADPKAELLRQIRTIRARLDPDVLARAERAAQAAQPGGQGQGAGSGADPGVEPYDKEAARNAVMLFLQSRHDGGRFATQVMEKLKQPEAAAKAYGRGAGMPGPLPGRRRP